MRFGVRALAGAAAMIALAPLVLGQAAGGGRPLISTAKPWPAPVDKSVPEASPVLSPAEAIKTFAMPPGWHVELVAAEPLVSDPIIAEYDGDGRLWVLEMHGYAVNEKIDNSFEPINDLVVLEDTNGDGVYDKRTVFLDKLVMPRAFKTLANGCALVGEPPHLWKACDTNGDLKADTKELVADSFAKQGVVEHGASGLYWGMDNTIYVSEHDWNLTTRGGRFVTEPTPVRGQWGVTQDDGGRIYRDVNTDPLFVDYVPGKYYLRNPDLARTRGLYESLARQDETNIWPIRPTLGINRGYRKETTREDGSSSYYQSVSSPMIYRGDRLPKEFYGQPFVVDGATNLVHAMYLKDDGAGRLSAGDYYKKGEFLASTDERFRPTWLTPSYDGSFLVVDMYRGVSQDGPLQTDYLRQYTLHNKLWQGIHYGRIYRVVRDGMTFDRKPTMSKDGSAKLVTYLSHPNGWWRDTAQQLLVQRNDRSVVPALRTLAQTAPDWRARLQALWTLDGLGAVDAPLVLHALDDKQADIRASALRLAEPLMADSTVRAAVVKRVDDANWFVRRQLAATLGALPADTRLAPLVAMLQRHGDDQATVDAAVSSLADQEELALARLLATPNPSLDAVMVLAGSTGKGRDAAASRQVLAMATDPQRPAPIRRAMMIGLTAGIRGTGFDAMTSQVVAGGRAGAGGEGPRRTAVVKRLELPAEPATLALAARGTGSDADAAKELLDVLGWPGKPTEAVAAVKRTPQQEVLFAAGKGVYDGLCTGCHMANGQGAPNVAAALAGSRYVNGEAAVMAGILFAGKEGKIGLMPPVGEALNDEELAQVMTFVRGSFGNAAAPVSPAQTKEWRTLYAARKTPFSEAELAAGARPSGGGPAHPR